MQLGSSLQLMTQAYDQPSHPRNLRTSELGHTHAQTEGGALGDMGSTGGKDSPRATLAYQKVSVSVVDLTHRQRNPERIHASNLGVRLSGDGQI